MGRDGSAGWRSRTGRPGCSGCSANRADTEAPEPLIAHHRSFADAGETAPPIAVDGFTEAPMVVPYAPATRLALGRKLAARGGCDSPERAPAEAVLQTLPAP